MLTLDSDKTVWFDVDDTLVKWSAEEKSKTVKITCEGYTDKYEIIWGNVKALKAHRNRGHVVIVWSAGGYKWAEAVVKALNLEKYVNLVCCKPSWIYDDLDSSAWMPKPKFGEDDPGHQDYKIDQKGVLKYDE